MRRALVLAGAAVACAASALGTAGCGASSTIDPVAQAAVARAAAKSTASAGFQMTLSMRVDSPALPSAVTATGQGAFDERSRTGSVILDMNLGNSPQVIQTLGSSTLHLEERIERTTVYVKLPASIAGKVPALGSRPWIKLDLAKAAAAVGIPGFSSLFSNPASSDPSQMLRYLRAISGGSVSRVGSEPVDGLQTIHYRGDIQLDRVPDAFPTSSRRGVRKAVSAIEQLTGLHALPVDVWIDSQHLVRRFRTTLQEKVPGGQTLRTALMVNLVQYGAQPPVATPPAGQVLDLTRSLGGTG